MNATQNNNTIVAGYSLTQFQPAGTHTAQMGGPLSAWQPREVGPSGHYIQTLEQREHCRDLTGMLTGMLLGFLMGLQQCNSGNAFQASQISGLRHSTPSNDFPMTELQRGDSRSLGGNQVDVDANGSLSFRQGDSQQTAFNFGQSVNGNSCGRSVKSYGSLMQATKSGQKFKVENGQIVLPNGKTIPFNNTGAIVVLPDGTQVAVGRQNSSNGPQQNRWVVAGASQEIPCSPSGATTVYRLNENGDVTSTSVK